MFFSRRDRRPCAVGAIILVFLPTAAAWPSSDISVSKIVEPEVITAGATVEFEIVVSNAGPDAALDVHLIEQLPAELQVPAGTAVSVSQGFYDADSGDWTIGDVAAGAMATMTIPAELAGSQPPPCIVNTVSFQPLTDDLNADDDSSTASVRQPGVDRCVDLVLENTLFSVPDPFCSDVTTASLTLLVRNNGPDEARLVEVVVSQSPERLPNFGFSDSECPGDRSGRCEVGTIVPGGLRVLTLTSDEFNNRSAYTITLHIEASGLDADYAESDNVLSVVREVPVTVSPPCDIPLPSVIGAPDCFIATAAWGTPWHENVAALRTFRDRWLLTNRPGQAFVAYYYQHSPPLAAYIADKPLLRAMTRAALTPAVVTLRHPARVVLFTAMICCLIPILHATARRGHPQ